MSLRRALSASCSAFAVLATLIGPAAAPAAAATPLVAAGTAPVSPRFARDLAALPATTSYAALVHFRGGTAAGRAALLVDHGLTAGRDFDGLSVTFAVGTLGELAGLRREPMVSYVESPEPLRYFGETAVWSTNVRAAHEAVGAGPYRDAQGRVLDGAGVGVAVIDAGVDVTHPDLAGRVAKNFKVACGTVVVYTNDACPVPVVAEVGRGDTTIGHGTHVAGIAVGDGTASAGTYRGVAPGARLYGYAIEVGDRYLFIAEAFDHMLDNYDTFVPRIRVVNNSWGNAAGTPYDPNALLSKLTKQLVAKGATVVFSAGNGDALNNGGTGADDRLSSTAKDPTPGVISVANYDDADSGTKSGVIDPSSSRGRRGALSATANHYAYPDIAAPGMFITSTCSPGLLDCTLGAWLQWAPWYGNISGTSMSAPHVSGIAALLYQAVPSLTPAQLEETLKDTALKIGAAATYEADPANPGGTVSFDKGAGLVDAVAALDALGVAHDGGEVQPGTPRIRTASPASGAENDGTAPLLASGTATDGWVAPAPLIQTTVVPDETGDAPAPFAGAADIATVRTLETATGIRVTIGVRDVQNLGANGLVGFYLNQRINGTEYQTIVDLRSTGATARPFHATDNNAVATALAVDPVADTLSYTLPFSSLGNPAPGSIAYTARVLAYSPNLVDVAPGGLGHEADTNPRFGTYTIRRPSGTTRPVAAVRVSVDGGPAQPAVLAGADGAYDWSAAVDTSGLAEGDHTITATLLLDGVARVTDTVGFTVRRPVVVTYALDLVAPADGATLPREVVSVSGTSATNAPAGLARRVTVQVTGPAYDSGELLADGTDAWTLPLDAGALAAGAYTLLARFHVGDAVVATDSVTVLVPQPPVYVSCAPEGLSFWQEQFNGSRQAVFTSAEANALADRAVVLSTDYFKDRQSVVNVLYAKGKLPAETLAARQFAVLLLNRAAGELSATMSAQAGLSGAEALDPAVYDTATLGTTVAAATAWVRAQLPGGDLAGADEVATAINTGTGLAC